MTPWILLAMHDPEERRGLWVRVDDYDRTTILDLCSGRHGDDSFVRIKLGVAIDGRVMDSLVEVLSVALAEASAHGPDLTYEVGRAHERGKP